MRVEVAYWTRFHEPDREAVSREIQALHEHFEGSRVFNVTRELGLDPDSSRTDVPDRMYPLQAVLLLSAGRRDVLHTVSGSWRSVAAMARLIRAPTVLTVTEAFDELSPGTTARLRRFSLVAVESRAYSERLVEAGLPEAATRCILPGVDLGRMRPTRPPEEPFTLVFASAPFEAAHIESRGLRLLLEAAGGKRYLRLRIVWRGRARAALDRLIEETGAHVEVVDRVVRDVSEIYRGAHATAIPFVGEAKNKLCPHTLMESLAHGKPVLVTEDVAVHDVVREEGCGVIVPPAVDGLRDGIDTLVADYEMFRKAARPAAERHFDVRRFLREYEDLYRGLTGS